MQLAHKIVIGFALCLIILLMFRPAADATPEGQFLALKFQDPKAWSHDAEIEEEIQLAGPKHYFFSASEDIDLNIVPVNDDLLSSLNSRGTKNFVDDFLRGKNLINKMFTVGESELKSESLKELSGGAKILTMQTSQMLADDRYETIEKVFIYPRGSLQVALRWKSDADAELIAKAQAEFERLDVRPAGASAK